MSDSFNGIFFCENSSGQQSDEVSINVTVTSWFGTILEIPALPVRAGSNVTLRCRHKFLSREYNHRYSAEFYFKGSRVVSEHQSELLITNVQKSDEGFYSCLVDQHWRSPQSFLRVRESDPSTALPSPPPTASSTPPPPLSLSHTQFKFLCYLLAFCPYCISAGLLMYICCSRKLENKPAITMEMTQNNGGGDKLDEEWEVISDDVTTERYV
ncbi:contactin-4-like [Astatotilapia calliptera]|nr:contactin-4-like [Astatotilapia calliptera]XP_039883783.1 contactin-4-like [Simochromis diagramma]